MYFNSNISLGPRGVVNSVKGNVVGDDGTVFEDGGNTYVSGSINRPSNVQPGGTPQVGQPRVVDPLGCTGIALCDSKHSAGEIWGSLRHKPQRRARDLRKRDPQGHMYLKPGLYVFTGTVDLAGGATLIANGATLYFTCGSGTSVVPCKEGDEGGRIDMTGTAQMSSLHRCRSTHPTVPEELYWVFPRVRPLQRVDNSPARNLAVLHLGNCLWREHHSRHRWDCGRKSRLPLHGS